MPFKTKKEKSDYDKKRYLERRDLKLAYMKQYRTEHPEVRRAWTQKNRDKINAQRRASYPRYRERQRAWLDTIRHTEDFRDKATIRRKRWIVNNPEKYREGYLAAAHRRRGKIKNGNIKTSDLKSLFKNTVCGICGGTIEDKWHYDHITPVSKGGLHIIENLQLAHPLCNMRKSDKLF